MPPQLVNQTEIILDKDNTEEVGEQRQVVQVRISNYLNFLHFLMIDFAGTPVALFQAHFWARERRTRKFTAS
jgi:hypothetical protein